MESIIGNSWKEVLQTEFEKSYFIELMKFLDDEYKHQLVYPKQSLMFQAFNSCPFEKVKVVIIGQDPYHTKGMADGMCFSVPECIGKLPPSLKNIFKELNEDIGLNKGTNGNLEAWAKQGVLLMNTVLTVRESEADSHAGRGWEHFTDAVIRELNARKKNVVYILWGNKAQMKASVVDENNNLVLSGPHPSPLSAHRGFFGGKYFSKTNDFLRTISVKEISW